MPGRGCNLAMLKWVKRNHELSGTRPPGGEKGRCEGSKVEASLVFSSQRLMFQTLRFQRTTKTSESVPFKGIERKTLIFFLLF